MAFWDYLRYRLRARGRHGTHSPFFYRLAEDCLMREPSDAALRFARTMQKDCGWHKPWSVLVFRLLEYYRPELIRVVLQDEDKHRSLHAALAEGGLYKAHEDEDQNRPADFFIILDHPAAWEPLLLSVAQQNTAIMLVALGNQGSICSAWKALRARPEVKASADVFCGGLLLFDQAFQQPQHVVLRQRT